MKAVGNAAGETSKTIDERNYALKGKVSGAGDGAGEDRANMEGGCRSALAAGSAARADTAADAAGCSQSELTEMGHWVLAPAASFLLMGARAARHRAFTWGHTMGAHKTPAARLGRPSRSGMVGE